MIFDIKITLNSNSNSFIMKLNFTKNFFAVIVALFIFGCSKDNTTTETSSSSSSSTSNTWVKMTAISATGTPKPNYIIMMFDQPFNPNNTQPLTAVKQATTDVNGLAYFDLSTIVTSTTPKKYYFEAFLSNGTNYSLKSVTHPSEDLSKGTMFTTSIIVN